MYLFSVLKLHFWCSGICSVSLLLSSVNHYTTFHLRNAQNHTTFSFLNPNTYSNACLVVAGMCYTNIHGRNTFRNQHNHCKIRCYGYAMIGALSTPSICNVV